MFKVKQFAFNFKPRVGVVDFELVSEYWQSAQSALATAVVARDVSLAPPVEVVDGVGVIENLNILLYPPQYSMALALLWFFCFSCILGPGSKSVKFLINIL